MSWQNPGDDELRNLLETSKTIAVVGCSPDPSRASHHVAAQLQERGARIIPVHPAGGTILGEKVYPDLDSVPRSIEIDIVDVFRRSEETPAIAEAAVRAGARALWLQQGVVNPQAYETARKAGLVAVMDLCLGATTRRLVPGGTRSPDAE